MGRFDRLDDRTRRTLSLVDNAYTDFLQILTDEAKEDPRLFGLVPIKRSELNPKQWTSTSFYLTLWCEHSKLPLPAINGKNNKKGVYEIELTRDWFKSAAPFLKILLGTLSLVLPVASSAVKLVLDDTAYKAIEEQLEFGKEIVDACFSSSEKIDDWPSKDVTTNMKHGEAILARGATIRELHTILREKDPGFGGLVRVVNKRQEFLWVHPQFENEY